MYTQLTTTLSFPSNTEKLYLLTKSRSQSTTWQRKLGNAMISSLKRWDMIKTISIYWQAFHQNTVVQMWYECSKALLPENYSNNFLCSRKICGEVNSGVMVSTLPQSASGETGMWSNSTSQVRERQRKNCDKLDYSPKVSHRSYPVGLPRGN
jgi:hypothetical protein